MNFYKNFVLDLIKKLEALATQNKISLNQLVIQCLNYAVNNIQTETDNGNNTNKKTDT